MDRADETTNTAGRPQPSPSTMNAPRTGPIAKPIGDELPKIAIAVPIRPGGAASRMAPSMTPVLPSWKPTRSMLAASCHGSRDRAMAPNTTASTSAERAITAFRLYLSAQTPQSGTRGMPKTKMRALNSPTNWIRSASARPIARRYDGTNAKIWLTPRPSTIDVIQKIARRARQSWRGWAVGAIERPA